MKKLISVILSIIMLFSISPIISVNAMYNTTQYTSKSLTDADVYSFLQNNWFQNNIQCECYYRFNDDGTCFEYYGDFSGIVDYNHISYRTAWTYSVNNGNATLVSEDGYSVTLYVLNNISEIPQANLDQGILEQLREIPADEQFLYELDWSKDAAYNEEYGYYENAFYMRAAAPITTPGSIPSFFSNLIGTWQFADFGKYIFSSDGTYAYYSFEAGPDSAGEMLTESGTIRFVDNNTAILNANGKLKELIMDKSQGGESFEIAPIDKPWWYYDEAYEKELYYKIDDGEGDTTPTNLEQDGEITYVSIVQQAINNKEEYGLGYGFLFDSNDDGVEELFLLYMPKNTWAFYGAVYTLNGEVAVPIHEESELCIDAGVSYTKIGVISLENTRYICVMGGVSSTEVTNGRDSEYWSLYRVDSNGFFSQDTITWERYYKDQDSEIGANYTITRNGVSYAKEKYDQMMSSIHYIKCMSRGEWITGDTSYGGNAGIMDLETLLAYLKEHPVTAKADSPTYEEYIRNEWIKQHMEYAASEAYSQEIVSGYSRRLLAVFRDALDDKGVNIYKKEKIATKVLGLDFEFSEEEFYEFIFAKMIYDSARFNGGQNAYMENLNKAVHDVAGLFVDVAKTIKLADKIGSISDDSLSALDNLFSQLQTLNIESDGFDSVFGQFTQLINENFSKYDFLRELDKKSFFLALEIGADILSEKVDKVEDILLYLSNYIAFQATSRQFRDVLNRMLIVGIVESDYDTFSELDALSRIWNVAEFRTAIANILDAFGKYEKEGAKAVAQYAVEREKAYYQRVNNAIFRNAAEFGIDELISLVPYINICIVGKDLLNISVIMSEFLTNVDEREFAADMLTKIYCLSVILDAVADDFAREMNEDDFDTSVAFDEAVNIYKGLQLLAVNYALDYTEMVLANVIAELNYYDYNSKFETAIVSRETLIQAVEWFKNSYKLLEKQKADIEAISCHKSDYMYNAQSNRVIHVFEDSRIHIVACPVDVIVKDEDGIQIAFLSGKDNQVTEGYEYYFRTINTAEERDEFIKIAVVPNGYSIELKGTDTGEMNAFVIDFKEDSSKVETFFSIPISNTSLGYFEPKSGSTNETLLVMDKTTYMNMESIEDSPQNAGLPIFWIILGGGALIVVLVLVIVLRKKSRKKQITSNSIISRH